MSNPDDGDDDADGDDAKTHHDYRIAKNPRATHPDDAGPRDPAQDRDDETGFEDIFPGDGTTLKSAQEEVEAALDAEGWDPLGADPVEKGEDGEKRRLSLSEADLEDVRRSPDERREDLLRQAVGELHRLNRAVESGDSLTRKDVEKAFGESAAERWVTLLADDSDDDGGNGDARDPWDRLLNELEDLEAALDAAA